MLHPPRALAVFAMLTAGAAGAQDGDDRRDVVELVDGSEHRGRVLEPFAADEVVLGIGGRRQRFPRDRVRRISTVDQRLAEVLELRRAGMAVELEWGLAEAARDAELLPLARLLAYRVLRREPDHEAAHALLGHRRQGSGWRWLYAGEPASAQRFVELSRRSDFELGGEHFVVRGGGSLATAVDALLDLEALYVAFVRELGTDLRPTTVLRPIEVEIHASQQNLPKLTSWVGDPYCDPSLQGGERCHTFVAPGLKRPAHLLAIATEQLLYRSLLGIKAGPPDVIDHRILPWAEVGLGRWFESRASGPPGHVVFGEPRIDGIQAANVLDYRPYGIENLQHLRFLHFHEDARAAPFHLANVTTLVAFLMAGDVAVGTPPGPLRSRFLAYVREAFAAGRGGSSSQLDAALSPQVARAEELEAPWIAWLEARTGLPARRRPYPLPTGRSLRRRVLGPLIR